MPFSRNRAARRGNLASAGLFSAIAVASFTLGGCLDVTEELRVNGDGSGRLKLDIALSDKVGALATLAGDKTRGTLIDAEAIRVALEDSDNIESSSVTTREVDGFTHTQVDAVVKDFTRPLPDFQAAGSPDGSGSQAFRFERAPNRNLRFVQPLFAPDLGERGKQATGLLAGLALADRYLTVRLYGNIASANGTIAEDRRSVEWRIPVSQILSGTAVIKQLEAEISPPAFSGLTVTIVIFIVIAALVIGAVILFRRRLLS